MIDQILNSKRTKNKREYYGKLKLGIDYPYQSSNFNKFTSSKPLNEQNIKRIRDKATFSSNINFELYKNLITKKEEETLNNENNYRNYMLKDKRRATNIKSPPLETGNMVMNNNNPFSRYSNSYIAENSRVSTDITNPNYFSKKYDSNYIKHKLADKEYLKYNYYSFIKQNPSEQVRKSSFGKYDYYNDLNENEDLSLNYAGGGNYNLNSNNNIFQSQRSLSCTKVNDANDYLCFYKKLKNNDSRNVNGNNNINGHVYLQTDTGSNSNQIGQRKTYDLGKTNLEHNVILNPINSYNFHNNLNRGRKSNVFVDDLEYDYI